MNRQPYLVLHTDDVEAFTHPDEPHYHSRHVLGRETAGTHDLLLNHGTVDAGSGLSGTNHPDNDEIYYVVAGTAVVDLGGDPATGEGSQTYSLEPGMVVFVPAGTFHRLRNETGDAFKLLTIWPQAAQRGANGIHDARLDAWGTGFRLGEGKELMSVDGASRVVDASRGRDPLVR